MSLAREVDNLLPSSPRMIMGAEEDLSVALRRMALEQAEVITGGFISESDDEILDNNVHLARKAGKRLRALLRLCRDELGDDVYRTANTLVRDRGRRLSSVRVSRVLVNTLDGLVEESVVSTQDAAALRAVLGRRHSAALAQLRHDAAGREEAQAALAGFVECVERFPAPARYQEDDLAAVEPAVERSYRAARRGMRRARDVDTAHALHEWRKRVNVVRYQMEALTGACAPPIGAMAETLDELSEVLGDDHDLADLLDCCTGLADGVVPAALLVTLPARSEALREQAFEIAAAVFAEKPKDFVRFFAEQSRSRG